MKGKGFTLIELLAVIVIIAIIALITIPLIGRVIENSKKGALTASASGIIEAAEIYYSTKMMENPETKTFMCSNEGCLSGEEKLDYKGQVSEGRVILYADGKVSICIEDGTNASLKLAQQSEITTEEGSCNYDDEDYSIDATVSKSKYNELQAELNNGKKVIANAITNKGVTTSETATFEEMATNIDSISMGDLEKAKLLEALQYSDLGLTEDSTADEIYAVLAAEYPDTSNFNYLQSKYEDWTVTGGTYTLGDGASTLVATLNTTAYATYNVERRVKEGATLSFVGKITFKTNNIPTEQTYTAYGYLDISIDDGQSWTNLYTVSRSLGPGSNSALSTSFDYSYDLSAYVGYDVLIRLRTVTNRSSWTAWSELALTDFTLVNE